MPPSPSKRVSMNPVGADPQGPWNVGARLVNFPMYPPSQLTSGVRKSGGGPAEKNNLEVFLTHNAAGGLGKC